MARNSTHRMEASYPLDRAGTVERGRHYDRTSAAGVGGVESAVPTETTPRGFEPPWAEPNGFRVHLLNRSDTVSCLYNAGQLVTSKLVARLQPGKFNRPTRPMVTVAILAQGTNRALAVTQAFCWGRQCQLQAVEGARRKWMSASVGGRSQADRLERNTAMDDSIGGS